MTCNNEWAGKSVLALMLLTLVLVLGLGCREAERQDSDIASPSPAEKNSFQIVELPPARLEAADIELAEVVRAHPRLQVPLNGIVAYDETRTARVSSRIGGRVVKLLRDFGDFVRVGDTLCIIDTPELGEAQAEYLSRLAEHEVARKAAQRAFSLVENQAISQGEYLAREGTRLRSEAALGFAENRLHLLDMTEDAIQRLGKRWERGENVHGVVSPLLELNSPVAGTVTRVEISSGEVVDRLQTLFVVSDLSRLWVWLDVYEKDIGKVRPGQVVEIIAEALEGLSFHGQIDFIGEVETKTRAAQVRVRLRNSDGRLRPGIFVRATLEFEHSRETISVPRAALQDIGGITTVFVEQEVGRFRPVIVRTGEILNGNVEVLDGLHEGQRIVSRGAFTLKGELLKDELGEEE